MLEPKVMVATFPKILQYIIPRYHFNSPVVCKYRGKIGSYFTLKIYMLKLPPVANIHYQHMHALRTISQWDTTLTCKLTI